MKHKLIYIIKEISGGLLLGAFLIGVVIIGMHVQVGLQIDCIGLTDPAPKDNPPKDLVIQDTYAAGFRLTWLQYMPVPEVTPVDAETVQAAPVDRWTPEEQELLAHLVMAEA